MFNLENRPDELCVVVSICV